MKKIFHFIYWAIGIAVVVAIAASGFTTEGELLADGLMIWIILVPLFVLAYIIVRVVYAIIKKIIEK